MVAGIELALILRAKGGRAFLTQARGIDIKATTDATWEVASALAHHSSAKGRQDVEQSGDTCPSFVGGDMPASNGRYRVVYRLAGKLYVMAVIPASGNIFFATRIVNAATHYLVSVNRGVNITADKIASRFPEVYLALSELIANGGNLERATADAEAAVDALSSEAAKTVKALKKSFTIGKKAAKVDTTGVSASNLGPLSGGRTLADEVDPLRQAAFEMPADALPPLQYVPPETSLAVSARNWGGFDGYRLIALDVEAASAEEEEIKKLEKGGDWRAQAPGAEPAPEAPPLSALEDISYPDTTTGPRGLWLEETWRCHVVGGVPQRMGTRGRVMGNAPATRAHLHTIFRLRPPEGAAPPLAAAVRAAKPNREIAVSGEEIAETAFVAYFDRIFGRTDPVFLEYRLPAIAMPAPLQIRFLAFIADPSEQPAATDGKAAKHRKKASISTLTQTLTLVLRYVNPASLPASLYEVAVDMDVHPHLAAPTKVSPEASWCAKQHRLRWLLPAIAAGQSGDLKAQFCTYVGDDPLRSEGALGGVTAAAVAETLLRMRFVGPPHGSLSGATLECVADAETFEPAGNAAFYGELTAQPELRHFTSPASRTIPLLSPVQSQ